MKKLNNIIILIIVLLFSSELVAQYVVDWAKGFGGDRQDNAKCVIETRNGDLVFAGTAIKSRTHLWLLTTNSEGMEIWGKTYDDSYSSGANCVIQTRDLNLVTAGFRMKRKKDRNTDGLVMKTDSEGKIIWFKYYGGKGDDVINDIYQTNDGGYIAVGYSTSKEELEKEFWILFLDEKGELINEIKHMDTEEDVANAVIQTEDGNFVVVGYALYGEKKILRIMKINGAGDIIWDLPFRRDFIREAQDILELPGGNLIIVGQTIFSEITNFDALFLKYDSSGALLESKTFGTDNWEEATNIIRTYDNNIAICGFEKSKNYFYSDFWVRKTDTTGNLLWKDSFRKKSLDYPNSIIQTDDNGLLIAGSTMQMGKGWDYAAMKYRDVNKTDIIFKQPFDFTSTSITSEYEADITVRSFDEPKNVDIIVNGILQIHDAYNERLISSAEYQYPIMAILNLQEGMNIIRVIVTDKRNNKIIQNRIIFYIPANDINW